MFDIEKEKEKLLNDNYNRKTDLPKRLQQVYDTLMDNGIEVSDCYWEYEDESRKSDGGQWWFELGGTIDGYSWCGGDIGGCGTITGSNTGVVDMIKNQPIDLHLLDGEQYKNNSDPTLTKDHPDYWVIDKDFNPYTKKINSNI